MSLEAKIRSEIERLRKLEEKAFGPRHGKYDFYDYLEGVWDLYLKWKKLGRPNPAQVGLHLCTNSSSGRTPIRPGRSSMRHRRKTLRTKASGREPSNMRREIGLRLKSVGLRKFLEGNGGPAGCAGKGATRRSGEKTEGSFKLGAAAIPHRVARAYSCGHRVRVAQSLIFIRRLCRCGQQPPEKDAFSDGQNSPGIRRSGL